MKKEVKALVCPKCNCVYGAPMGRADIGSYWFVSGKKIRDVRIPVNSQGYDSGGAYWGVGGELRCKFTSDGLFRLYYRKGA